MTAFNPFDKETQLKAQASAWNTDQVSDAQQDDIPVIDLGRYLTGTDSRTLDELALQLRIACKEVGFFSIVGHGVSAQLVEKTLEQVRLFHELPIASKTAIRMDRPDWPHGGMGYLPIKNNKLPSREKVNFNEAFLIKCDDSIGMSDNQWPDVDQMPLFRNTVQDYAQSMVNLGKRLLPLFARALDMPANYFEQAFSTPTYRLRMTHYPPIHTLVDDKTSREYGINPHVDTTFCTILAQDRPGLTIYSERKQAWLEVPMLEDAFVVNTGELLRQWTNDEFISVKHFANNNTGTRSRYSIPFFFNANAHHVMHCIPSCCDEQTPAKYPPVSYAGSQAIAQGE